MATRVQHNRKVNKLRYAEYYEQTDLFDALYAKSTEGYRFKNLIPLITSRDNILMAYRSIKSNSGSVTPGTDHLTIHDVEKLDTEEFIDAIRNRFAHYIPNPVKRTEIPKPNGGIRPLGIPSIWDRLVQQCILQILEPICEAKFSDNSYGFRPMRSTEHAIAAEMKLINRSKLHYVVEIDIKGFFDEVNHSKLLKQMWSLGIQDKKLIAIIKQMLKAPIRLPDGATIRPTKGTPQGGILSPLLANIVLNELDQWIDSQWIKHPVLDHYVPQVREDGHIDNGNGYQGMRKTKLKEMHIVRYADDIRILCRTRSQAERTMIATKQWLFERLHLVTSDEKTRVVNLRKQNSEFLGFSIKLTEKRHKLVAKSHISKKTQRRIISKLKTQIKAIQHPANSGERYMEIQRYNAMVRGMHNYYQIATEASQDFAAMARILDHAFKARLKKVISKTGTIDRKSADYARYHKSMQLRYIETAHILPLGYCKHANPMCKRNNINIYTPAGRANIHDAVTTGAPLMSQLASHLVQGRSVEYNDNRISLYTAQKGKCYVTGHDFISTDEIHCHHKIPISQGGTDKYKNLVLVNADVHRLIHATKPSTIDVYINLLNLNSEQLKKLNTLRVILGNAPI